MLTQLKDGFPERDPKRDLTDNEKAFLMPSFDNIREMWQSGWREKHPGAVVVYVLRHGESITNLKKVTQTRNHVSPLTLHGIRQAKAATKFLAGVPFDLFVSSGAERAYHSLRFLLWRKGRQAPTWVDCRLSESNMYPVGGVPTHLASQVFDPGNLHDRYPESFTNLHLQSLNGFSDDVRHFYAEFLSRPRIEGKTALFASHGGSMVLQLMALGNIPMRKLSVVRNFICSNGQGCPNAGSCVFAFLPEEKRWQTLVLSDDTYLPSRLRRHSTSFDKFLSGVYTNFQIIFRRLKYVASCRKPHPFLQDYYPVENTWFWSLHKPDLAVIRKWHENFLTLHPGREEERLNAIFQTADVESAMQSGCRIPLSTAHPVVKIDNIAINLTNWCPVNCSFCFIKAVANRKIRQSLNFEAITRTLQYAKKWRVPRLDLSGGEALDEIETVLRIIKEADADIISITTSGYFATGDVHTEDIFDRLVQALETRKRFGKTPVSIDFYVSVDEFHASVPLSNICRIIRILGKAKYSAINLELRAILMPTDPVPRLVADMGGYIAEPSGKSNFPIKKILLPSGYEFTVKYGELKLLKDMIHTELSDKPFDHVYAERLKKDVVYIGRGKQNGASIDVSFNGVVTIQEYLTNDLPLGDANKENGFAEVDHRLMYDPLVVALREIGLNTVLDITARVCPGIRDRSIEANNMFLAVSDILHDHDLRDYIYHELIRIIEKPDEEDVCRIDWIPLNTPRPVNHYDNMYVELTNCCSVGCSFCFMKSVPDAEKAIRLQSTAINRILDFIRAKSIPLLNLTGGEPFTEMDAVLRFIHDAEVERLTIATSGYFAINESRTEEVLDRLAAALRRRENTGKKSIRIDFRVSADRFHWHVTSKVLPNLIRAFSKFGDSKYRGIVLSFLGIMSKDDPMPGFVKEMGGLMLEDTMDRIFPTKKIMFSPKFSTEIKYGEMKITEDQMRTNITSYEFDKIYGTRLAQEVIYIGRGEKGGVSVSVSHDGVVSQQEFLSRKFPLTSIYSENFSKEIETRLTRDPLVVALREIGLNTVLDIAAQLRPQIKERSIEANNQFQAVLDIIEDKELKVFVYKKLIAVIENKIALKIQ
ncbi:MAG: 4Fe-4S cluster-binding domain-containing protein [Dysgonamonadaceae bacterium]|jgi:probable phosphoglycerate mutase|nr:4Fe-4S cluster-binding domain-containing protein [Dysgonamonadaceae bacterium]